MDGLLVLLIVSFLQNECLKILPGTWGLQFSKIDIQTIDITSLTRSGKQIQVTCCLSFFSGAMVKHSDTNNLRDRGNCFVAAGYGRNWKETGTWLPQLSHILLLISRLPFHSIQGPAHDVLLFTVRVGCPTSVNPIKLSPYRNAQSRHHLDFSHWDPLPRWLQVLQVSNWDEQGLRMEPEARIWA